MGTTLIVAEGVVGHDGADSVVVSGENIVSVGTRDDLATGSYDQVVTLAGATLSPGFIDTHVHMTGNGLTSAPDVIQREPPSRLLLRAAANARQALAEGVTTMRDCGAHNEVAFSFRDSVDDGLIAAPNILAAGGTLTRTGGHGHWWGLEADGRDDVRTAIRSQSKAGADALKVMVDGGIDLGRHTPGLLYFDADAMADVVREAHDWGLRVAAHCLTAPGIRAAVEAGVDSVEHAIFYEANLDDTRIDDDVVSALVEKEIAVAPGPAFAYDVFTDPDAATTFPRNARLFRRRLEDNARLHEAGVRLVAGTDAGWYATPFGEFARCPELLVEHSGLTPSEALDACTIDAAASLGLGDRTGSIDPGKRADLVALDGDPRVDVSAMRRVRLTMARGAVLHVAPEAA